MADTALIATQFRNTFGDRFRSGAVMASQTVGSVIWILLFPLLAAALVGVHLYFGKPLGRADIALSALLLVFHPSMLTYHALKTHFLGKHKNQPFNSQFGDFGIRTLGDTVEITHSWKGISRIKRQGGVLLLFFSPGVAHCLPYRQLSDLGAPEKIADLARAHGVCVRDA